MTVQGNYCYNYFVLVENGQVFCTNDIFLSKLREIERGVNHKGYLVYSTTNGGWSDNE